MTGIIVFMLELLVALVIGLVIVLTVIAGWRQISDMSRGERDPRDGDLR